MSRTIATLQRKHLFTPTVRRSIAELIEQIRQEAIDECIGVSRQFKGGMVISLELQRLKQRLP